MIFLIFTCIFTWSNLTTAHISNGLVKNHQQTVGNLYTFEPGTWEPAWQVCELAQISLEVRMKPRRKPWDLGWMNRYLESHGQSTWRTGPPKGPKRLFIEGLYKPIPWKKVHFPLFPRLCRSDSLRKTDGLFVPSKLVRFENTPIFQRLRCVSIVKTGSEFELHH